jgi:predicted  nucleic acid-binding Zn-ribbon protein
MNKRIKKKKRLELEIQKLQTDFCVLNRENMDLNKKLAEYKTELNTLRQAQKRHETICGENVEATNEKFSSIKQELKKPFWKR